jgi:hypothetical protein
MDSWGLNLLGKALVEVRKWLREEAVSDPVAGGLSEVQGS